MNRCRTERTFETGANEASRLGGGGNRERSEHGFKRPLGAPPYRFGFDAAICLAGCWNRWKQAGQSKSRFSEDWLGQYLSKVSCQTVGMRIKKRCKIPPIPDETIGQFGPVRLVRKWGEVHELVGGNKWERCLVRIWCVAYAPFLVFAQPWEVVLSA